jgi:hypothetical protein
LVTVDGGAPPAIGRNTLSMTPALGETRPLYVWEVVTGPDSAFERDFG